VGSCLVSSIRLVLVFISLCCRGPSRTEIHTLSLHDALPICVTYVRTLISGKRESRGGGDTQRRPAWDTQKGTIPTQTCPSKVSSSSCGGNRGRSTSGASGK